MNRVNAQITPERFEALVYEHHRMVFSLACAYAGADAAEDICQDTYMRAFRSLQGLKDPSRFKPWLYSLARHAAIDHIRKERRMKVPIPVPAPQPSEETMVTEVLNRLREDYRQILMLRYVEGMSYQEIGEALDMTVTAVGEKLHRVRAMVADEVRRLEKQP